MKMKLQLDMRSDSLYLRTGEIGSTAETEEVDDGVIVDRDANGSLVGVEILYVSSRTEDGSLNLGGLAVGTHLTLGYDGKTLELAVEAR